MSVLARALLRAGLVAVGAAASVTTAVGLLWTFVRRPLAFFKAVDPRSGCLPVAVAGVIPNARVGSACVSATVWVCGHQSPP